MSNIVIRKIQLRRGTYQQWATANPVLSQGEPGYVTNQNTLKIGDGVTPFNSLPAISGSGGGGGGTPLVDINGNPQSGQYTKFFDNNTLTAIGIPEMKQELEIDNVDNTADADKPISTATQTALGNKVDKVQGYGLSQENLTTALLAKLESIEQGATADQTGAEIKQLYESVVNTNPYSDNEKIKVWNMEYGATRDQTGAEIEALLDAELGGTDWKTGGSGLTQEEIQDFVAPLLNHANHSNITVSYDDANNQIILTGTGGGGNDITVTSISGGADYSDTQYTTGSPFILGVADGKVNLPNNAGTIWDAEKPSDIIEFYDGTHILGQEGDFYNVTIEFKVRPTGPASNVRVSTTIDIGGAVGEIYPRDFALTKGNGVEHFYLSSFLFYTRDTWEANGGQVKIQAYNEDVEIYDIRYVIARSHKAGNEYIQNNAMTVDQLAAIINSNGATEANPFITNNDLPATVSQVDAEAGTSTTVYRWTPERIAQAIAALETGGGGSGASITGPVTADLNTIIENLGVGEMAVHYFASGAANKPVTLNDANYVVTMKSNAADFGKQIAFGDSGDIYIRQITNGTHNAWQKVYHEGNISEVSFTAGEITGVNSTDLNTIIGAMTGAQLRFDTFANSASNVPVALNSANGVITIKSFTGADYGAQIAFADNDEMYIRNISNGAHGTWYAIHHAGNFDPASKLSTAVASTATDIDFVTPRVFNLPASPRTGDITEDLTDAVIGVRQKIYHNDSVTPSFPAGWVELSNSSPYVTSETNIIYCEWVGATRVEYWIVQEA